jgi:hypothetical protein
MQVRRARLASVMSAIGVVALGAPAARTETAPPPLSQDTSPVDVASTYGSGSFGSWTVDRFGLPAYQYTIDEETAPQAKQAYRGGRVDAWHQLGNDHIVASAYNHGYIQLWSQDRLYQWTNLYDAAARHFGGGYGYVNAAGRVFSTLYDDRPAQAVTERDFGIGYARKRLVVVGLDIEEHVYAPFGDDPILLHDVTIANTSDTTTDLSWFEYWDVNPAIQSLGGLRRGVGSPQYDAANALLVTSQLPSSGDTDPLSIYAAVLRGPVSGYETDVTSFFGGGGRASPAAVTADRTSNSVALPSADGIGSQALYALRSPVSLGPGERATLRYAYGSAHRDAIIPLLDRYRAAADPLGDTERAWAAWVPKAEFIGADPSVARELQWSAYRVRSGASYEELCGYHLISEGGYYMYEIGNQTAYRSVLDHSLSMIYAAPELTREVIRYSAREQLARTGEAPYGMLDLCRRFGDLISNDQGVYLMLATEEYVLATRDFSFLDDVVPYYDGDTASVWEHVKLAHYNQEEIIGRGPHGGYMTRAWGDWSDFSTEFMQMTESILVSTQLAYIYPRLADVADVRGDHAFANELREEARDLRDVVAREWTGRGWFSRGYSGAQQIGHGVIYLEPQPWAVLAGAADADRAATLVANIRRFLTGIGAPGGPSLIGTAQSPARNDPDVEERTLLEFGVGRGNAVFVGGVWYFLTGELVWALTELDGVLPGANDLAWDEFLRNTLATHATAFPDAWSGVISSDDACHAWYGTNPSMCGIGLGTTYNTQNTTQPASQLFDLTKLAGITAGGDGYTIDPHVPFEEFSVRLPLIGVASDRNTIRGYVRPERAGDLVVRVRVPGGVDDVTAWVGGDEVAATVVDGYAHVTFSASAATATDWAVRW